MFLDISLDTLYSSYVSVCPSLVTGIHSYVDDLSNTKFKYYL